MNIPASGADLVIRREVKGERLPAFGNVAAPALGDCVRVVRGDSRLLPAGVEAEHTFAVFPESLGYETIVNYNFILTLHITLIIDISV